MSATTIDAECVQLDQRTPDESAEPSQTLLAPATRMNIIENVVCSRK